MEKNWHAFWLHGRKWLKTGWLITAVLVALYGGVIRPSRAFRGIAMEKTTALAAIERNRHWLVPLPQSVDNATLAAGVVGGVQGGVAARSAPTMTYLSTSNGLADSQTGPLIVHRSVGETSRRISRENPLTDRACRRVSRKVANEWRAGCHERFAHHPRSGRTLCRSGRRNSQAGVASGKRAIGGGGCDKATCRPASPSA